MNKQEQLNRYISGLRLAERRAIIKLQTQNTRKFPDPEFFRPNDYMAILIAIRTLNLLNHAGIQLQMLDKNYFSLN